ncbi:MAG: AAA family ATPase, partial [Proteobacteria bacterium]|nr:AAA family ATPase [Pseudomonadota bacterium]
KGRRKEIYEGRHALVLDYVDGRPLRLRPPTQSRELLLCLRIVARLCDVLAGLHANHLIHRDLKPENVLYDPATGALTVIDFGSASRIRQRATSLGVPQALAGTLAYISPEQTGRMDRVVDHRTDLYSLGVILFELLCGRRPFESDDAMALIHGHLAHTPPRVDAFNAAVPAVVCDLVGWLLEKNAEDRYASADLVAEDLRRCASALEGDDSLDSLLLQHGSRTRFLIPERLYGRDAQTAALLTAAERSAIGPAEIVTVSGASGTGKSRLVQQVQRAHAARGLYLTGKFDRLQRDIPYYAPIQAFAGFVEQLLSEEEEALATWRARLLEAVGELGGVLTGLIPTLEHALGPQPEVPELDRVGTRARFQYVFGRFVRALCAEEHPVVLFLDDVQWADRASLDLLEEVLSDPDAEHLLVVVAYRPGEVAETHPVSELLGELDDAGVRLTPLEVGNLSEDDLQAFVEDTLGGQPERELAQVLGEKTAGNPFFARQFLSSLHERGVLVRSGDVWSWEAGSLGELDITDNVARLLADNLRALPDATWNTLRVAACLGHRFELRTLAAVADRPVQDVASDLWTAVDGGFLLGEGDAYRLVGAEADASAYAGAELSFVHDRVQRAAYLLTEEAELPALHHQVGNVLRSTRPEALFEIVNHLNIGILAEQSGDWLDVAALNLAAGRRAKRAAAYDEALRYLEAGLARLPEDAWTAHYELARDLHGEAANVAIEADANERVDRFAAPLLAHASAPLERVPGNRARMMAASAVNDLPAALSIGLNALSELGEHFPGRPTPVHILVSLARVKFGLWGQSVDDLAARGPITAAEKAEAMWVLEKVVPTAFRVGSDQFPLIVLRLVELTLKHGNSPVSAFAYAGYAIMLCGILGDYEGGYRYGKLALSLAEKYPQDGNIRSKALFVFSNMVAHWRDPLRDSLEPLRLASRLGSESGSTFDAVWAALYRLMWLFVTGEALHVVEHELELYAGLLRRDESARHEHRLLRQLVANLRDPAHPQPWVLTGEHCEQAEIEAALCGTGDGTDEVIYWFCRGWVLALFGRHEEAVQAFEGAEAQFEAVVALPFIPLVQSYAGVSRCAVVQQGAHRGTLAPARRALKKLAGHAKAAPCNYAHRHTWLSAELAWADGERGAAREAFGRAASAARVYGWANDEAQILERATAMERALDNGVVAEALADRAAVAYRTWGAEAKLGHLSSTRTAHDTRSHGNSRTTESASEALDLASVMKASSAITSILLRDQLLKRLVEILVENAGASHGAIALKRDKDWFVEVSLGLESEARLGSVPLAESDQVCATAVRFSARSGRSLAIKDVRQDERYGHDPRVVEVGVRSLLCLPIVHGGRTIGVVYAENRHASGVFTRGKLAVLELLAVQAAISLENARLYQNLNESLARQVSLTEAHHRFVPQAFLDNLGADSIADVALGDAVEKDMSVLFSDIRGFTPLIEGLGAEGSIRFINGYLEFMEPPIHLNGGFVDSYIGDAIMALFEGGPGPAARAAVGMLRGLRILNARRASAGEAPIRMGIGISHGHVMMGTIGGSNRLKCGVIGDPVNLGARVESLTKAYGVSLLVTDGVYNALSDVQRQHSRLADRVVVKGKRHGVSIYEMFDADPDPVFDAKSALQQAHVEATEHYYARRFGQAATLFGELATRLPGDVVVDRYLRRARVLNETGVPEDWDGIEHLAFK